MTSEDFKNRYLPHYQYAYGVCMVMIHNVDDTKYIVQEVYAKLWHQRENLSEVNNERAFILTTAKNQALDFLKSKYKTIDFVSQDALDEDIGNDIENKLIAREDLLRVSQYMNLLSCNQRKVLKLRHWANLSVPEIAQKTHLSKANIRQLLSRARRKIREKITNDDDR